MKTCSQCSEQKPLNQFYKRKNGSMLSHCKTCDRQRKRKTQERWKQENQQLVEAFYNQPCIICGLVDKEVIHAHHIEGIGKNGRRISDFKANYSPKVLIRELEKCVPVCANDHIRLHKGIVELVRSN